MSIKFHGGAVIPASWPYQAIVDLKKVIAYCKNNNPQYEEDENGLVRLANLPEGLEYMHDAVFAAMEEPGQPSCRIDNTVTWVSDPDGTFRIFDVLDEQVGYISELIGIIEAAAKEYDISVDKAATVGWSCSGMEWDGCAYRVWRGGWAACGKSAHTVLHAVNVVLDTCIRFVADAVNGGDDIQRVKAAGMCADAVCMRDGIMTAYAYGSDDARKNIKSYGNSLTGIAKYLDDGVYLKDKLKELASIIDAL